MINKEIVVVQKGKRQLVWKTKPCYEQLQKRFLNTLKYISCLIIY